eukprot:scaffold24143_cov146-Isochrysis_galbana.AAC.3
MPSTPSVLFQRSGGRSGWAPAGKASALPSGRRSTHRSSSVSIGATITMRGTNSGPATSVQQPDAIPNPTGEAGAAPPGRRAASRAA